MRIPLLLIVALLTGGCALSPQTVELDPKITLAGEAPYVRGSASVTVFDERTNKVIGSRGGVYANSSNLTLADDFSTSVAREAERALQGMGLEIDHQNPLLIVNIYLDGLSYRVPDGNYVTQVDLSASLRTELQRGNQQFSGRYQAQSQHRVVKAPDDEKNQELINDVVNSALNRMFSDRSLLDFLASP
ncbi:YajG family lipoprotein [Aestuariirhabdus sp. LZHN29]|uniref:YajG family lipoprotein n=1 Tax=Aestuariirhabdus sp. LZHN29 TaxID=3417462 RepID=UPI003CF3AE22